MLRPLSTYRLAAPSARRSAPLLRPLATAPVRLASYVPKKPLPMPPDMPREDYAGPAAYAANFIGRTIKYIIYGAVGLSTAAYLGFEGMHAYVERVSLAAPSRAADDDAFAWADDNTPWTGGASGGTDPRLGWRGRHALRGAWICREWGAGDAAAGGAIARQRQRHPEFRKGMIGASPLNRVDRGYELADEYIDVAIRVAEQKGLVFPPHLPGMRERGPAGLARPTVAADPTALDLLALKAGVLERMGDDTLDHARELYERVATAYVDADADGGPVRAARAMRLAHKLGDLAQRAGEPDEARAWWAWGLARAGLELPPPAPAAAAAGRGWWFGKAAAPSEPAPTAAPAAQLPAPVLRAAVSILAVVSAADARSGALAEADAVVAQGLALLPPAAAPSVPGPGQGASGLQALWEAQRRALLTLFAGEVAHARSTPGISPLELVADASDASEAVLSILNPALPTALAQPRANPCTEPARHLVGVTLTTGAEAYSTQGALLERSAAGKSDKSDALHRLEHAGECYERAMSLSAAEEGRAPAAAFGEEDAIGRGEAWTRHWRGYVRVREKMVRLVEEGGVLPKHA